MRKNFINLPYSLHFRRFLSQIAEKPETNSGAVNNLSMLFVPSRYGGEVYQIVKPTIDIEYLTKNSKLIQMSCDMRNIKLQISEIINYANQWKILMDKKDNLSKKIRDYEKNKSSNDQESSVDKQYKYDLVKEVMSLKQELYTLDDVVVPLFAQIPNILHDATPTTSDVFEVICESMKFPFPVKSHIELATFNSCLEISSVSPTAYYLMGKLANLEQAVQSFFEEQLESKNFTPVLGPDFAKSFIFEAGGKDPYNLNDCIVLKREKKETGQRNNLIGGSSFETFCAYFINMNADKNTLPLKYYSSGRLYNPIYRESKIFSLFNVVQSNCLHCCIISEPIDSDRCFDELYNSLIHCFSILGLPYRTVNVSTKNLNYAESQKINIELWSPHQKKYILCGNVVQCNDFVSKRLQMSYGIDFQKHGYLNFVHGFAVNIPVFLGCSLENMQQADSIFLIPPPLQKYMLE